MSRMVSTATASACVSCGAELRGRYCSECGEQRFVRHALTLRHFVEHAFEAVTHVDGTIFRTLRSLIIRPGELTADYVAGRRKIWLAPVQLFLILNVVYFVAHALHGWNTLTTDLRTHMRGTYHREFAVQMVDRKLSSKSLTLDQYRRTFDAKAGIQAKSLVVLMVPLFAGCVALLQVTRRRFAVQHFVFALHFFSFFLLYLTVANLLSTAILSGLARLGVKFGGGDVDAVVSFVSLVILASWLYVGLRRAYGDSRLLALPKALVLAFGLIYILYVYRFALFLVTYSTM